MNQIWIPTFIGLLCGTVIGCSPISDGTSFADDPPKTENAGEETMEKSDKKMELATFGGGCFWCVEAVFQRMKGVEKVVSGYAGGTTENPTYEQICTGRTGHAEVVQITYDPDEAQFKDLLEVFWKTHDPTTLNRQGADVGTQYRSVIFYHNEDQKKIAEEYKEKLDKSGIFKNPIVTQIEPFTKMYVAEDYHQNYFNLNPRNPYCQTVVKSKVDKFREIFRDKMKEDVK